MYVDPVNGTRPDESLGVGYLVLGVGCFFDVDCIIVYCTREMGIREWGTDQSLNRLYADSLKRDSYAGFLVMDDGSFLL